MITILWNVLSIGTIVSCSLVGLVKYLSDGIRANCKTLNFAWILKTGQHSLPYGFGKFNQAWTPQEVWISNWKGVGVGVSLSQKNL